MNLKYKIVEANTSEHSIVVRFYTDVITEEMLATDILDGIIRRCRTDYSIDLPVPAPTGTDLQDFIKARAPIEWLSIQEDVLNPNVDTTLSGVTSLIGVETPVVIATTTPQTFVLGQIAV